jgi:hypothetical protein
MGINYFKVLPLTQDDIDKLDDLLKQVKSEIMEDRKISYETKEQFEEFSKRKVHLGKSSKGWQFLWNHNNGKYYDPNLKSIEKFLNEPGEIIDEHGEKHTPQSFMDEIRPELYNTKKTHNAELYHKLENDVVSYEIKPYDIEINGKKYTVTKWSEFESNRLRFSRSDKFR